jgi:hypothetical protein
MRARAVAIALCVAFTASLLVTSSAFAAKRCVGGPGCYRTIQDALNASRDGDVIKVGPGSFAGGIQITRSVSLVGAGAGSTVIRGGGPVVTIGSFGAAGEPTVSISGVKITGGRTSSSPEDLGGGFRASGGGIFVPPAAEFAAGATVTIRDSVIAGNRTAPTTTMDRPPGQGDWPMCPAGPCPFAQADGAGISTWGSTTLTDSVVSDNEAGGPVASDAIGAGIWSNNGTLTLIRSRIARNHAMVVPPNGRFAEGGGMFVQGGGLLMRDSVVADNATDITSTFPAFVGDALLEMTSQGGGVMVAGDAPATIERSLFTGNASTARDSAGGEPAAYDAGLLVLDGPLTMRDSVVSDNRAASNTVTTEDIGPAGAVLEGHGGGTLTNVRVVGNVSTITADRVAWATGAVNVFDFSGDPKPLRFVDSVISANKAVASSASGEARVQGAAIYNNSLLELRRTVVSDNVGRASAPNGIAEGGGIWNGVAVTGPPVELTLVDSLVARNSLSGGSGIERRGGGLFTTEPVTLTRTRLAGNVPDQCFGCSP